jgi:hypothetical protein
LEGAEQGAVTAVKIEGREPEPCDKVVIAMGPWYVKPNAALSLLSHQSSSMSLEMKFLRWSAL